MHCRSNSPQVRLKYALLLHEQGRFDEAWQHFEFAQNIIRQNRPDEFPKVTAQGVKTAQFVTVANLLLAEQLQDFDPAQAATFARTAVRSNPGHGLIHFQLAKILIKMKGNESEAVSEFEKALQYGHGDYLVLAKAYLKEWHDNGRFYLNPTPKPEAIPPSTSLSTQQ